MISISSLIISWFLIGLLTAGVNILMTLREEKEIIVADIVNFFMITLLGFIGAVMVIHYCCNSIYNSYKDKVIFKIKEKN